jgi:hypothetical protein
MNHPKIAQQILSDNSLLYSKISKATGIEEADVLPLFIELLRFMQLTKTAGERLSPSHIVDLAWHEFILFTKYYAAFCQEQFGSFVHHHPGGSDQENRHCFKKTHYWYQKTFGEPAIARFWGSILAEIADAGDCGV